MRKVEVDWQAGTVEITREEGKAETALLIESIPRVYETSISPWRLEGRKVEEEVGGVPAGFAGLDAVLAAREERVEVRSLLVPGKVTILDFYAEWCAPCKVLSDNLKVFLREQPGVALRKIDIVSWESPVAKQCTEEFGMAGLPYVRIYGGDGRFIADLGSDFEKIRAIVAKAVRETTKGEGQ